MPATSSTSITAMATTTIPTPATHTVIVKYELQHLLLLGYHYYCHYYHYSDDSYHYYSDSY
eukprot:9196341-Pyramimonas_sp.AAC.1